MKEMPCSNIELDTSYFEHITKTIDDLIDNSANVFTKEDAEYLKFLLTDDMKNYKELFMLLLNILTNHELAKFKEIKDLKTFLLNNRLTWNQQ